MSDENRLINVQMKCLRVQRMWCENIFIQMYFTMTETGNMPTIWTYEHKEFFNDEQMVISLNAHRERTAKVWKGMMYWFQQINKMHLPNLTSPVFNCSKWARECKLQSLILLYSYRKQLNSQLCEKFKVGGIRRCIQVFHHFLHHSQMFPLIQLKSVKKKHPDKVQRCNSDISDARNCGTPWKLATEKQLSKKSCSSFVFWCYLTSLITFFSLFCSKFERVKVYRFQKSTLIIEKCWYNISHLDHISLSENFKNIQLSEWIQSECDDLFFHFKMLFWRSTSPCAINI